jgi:hypothetical protein
LCAHPSLWLLEQCMSGVWTPPRVGCCSNGAPPTSAPTRTSTYSAPLLPACVPDADHCCVVRGVRGVVWCGVVWCGVVWCVCVCGVCVMCYLLSHVQVGHLVRGPHRSGRNQPPGRYALPPLRKPLCVLRFLCCPRATAQRSLSRTALMYHCPCMRCVACTNARVSCRGRSSRRSVEGAPRGVGHHGAAREAPVSLHRPGFGSVHERYVVPPHTPVTAGD